MTSTPTLRRSFTLAVLAVTILATPSAFGMQGRAGSQSENLAQASQLMGDGKSAEAIAALKRELAANPSSVQAANMLDVLGATADAKVVFQRLIDTATDPKAKADAQRAMAMSYAFDGNCVSALKYEQMVIAYWVTREKAEPQNAFYQEGEMANEAARVCIDAGDLPTAEKWYRAGADLGLMEPGNQTHPRSLWEFRLAHALGRVAARRINKAEAARQVAAARKALDSDPTMAAQQERFFPYLVGYVALYTNDLKTAETELSKTVAMAGNQNDPFMNCLLAMTYEKLGQADKARAAYQKAYGLATAHNPPAAFTRAFAKKKIG